MKCCAEGVMRWMFFFDVAHTRVGEWCHATARGDGCTETPSRDGYPRVFCGISDGLSVILVTLPYRKHCLLALGFIQNIILGSLPTGV